VRVAGEVVMFVIVNAALLRRMYCHGAAINVVIIGEGGPRQTIVLTQ
jgi:hypothetical protein